MAAPRFQLPYIQWVDPSGNVAVGWQLFFYLTGTDTPSPTYADPNLQVPNTNPVVSLANGQWPNIFLNPAVVYKTVLEDENGDLVWTADPVTASGLLYPVAFEFLSGSPPLASEVIGMHYFATGVTFPASFLGSGGYCLINPAATFVSTIGNQTGASIGTMSINTAGGFSFTSTNGQPVSAASGDTWIQKGSLTPDAQLANFAWTLAGVLST